MKRPDHGNGTSFSLAFEDREFLWRDEMRPMRLAAEFAKVDLALRDYKIASTVVFFGSARMDEGSVYYERARDFARRVSEYSRSAYEACNCERRDYVVITGGGPGLMEAANRGAADAGAMTIGLNILLPHEQKPNEWISPDLAFQFQYFAMRKMHFLLRARALVIFPGGFGTLDELFDALTLMQTGKMHRIPVLMFGADYWRDVLNLDAMVEAGTIDAADRDLTCGRNARAGIANSRSVRRKGLHREQPAAA